MHGPDGLGHKAVRSPNAQIPQHSWNRFYIPGTGTLEFAQAVGGCCSDDGFSGNTHSHRKFPHAV